MLRSSTYFLAATWPLYCLGDAGEGRFYQWRISPCRGCWSAYGRATASHRRRVTDVSRAGKCGATVRDFCRLRYRKSHEAEPAPRDMEIIALLKPAGQQPRHALAASPHFEHLGTPGNRSRRRCLAFFGEPQSMKRLLGCFAMEIAAPARRREPHRCAAAAGRRGRAGRPRSASAPVSAAASPPPSRQRTLGAGRHVAGGLARPSALLHSRQVSGRPPAVDPRGNQANKRSRRWHVDTAAQQATTSTRPQASSPPPNFKLIGGEKCRHAARGGQAGNQVTADFASRHQVSGFGRR